jgi:K+-transporting ATPase A subunit
MLMFQDKLPLNPDGNPGQTPDLAYNSIISFVTTQTCNTIQVNQVLLI